MNAFINGALIGVTLGLLYSFFFWPIVAWIVTRDRIFQALYRRAEKTPYWDLDGYMRRWWLFNPINTKYEHVSTTMVDGKPFIEVREVKTAKYPWCPVSARMHHILRADHARDKHNHPGTFRTIVGKGWYEEQRDTGTFLRKKGDTAVLGADEFHHVSEVSPGGVWTIFIMWDWRATWGFRKPDGTVVPHQDYHNGGMP